MSDLKAHRSFWAAVPSSVEVPLGWSAPRRGHAFLCDVLLVCLLNNTKTVAPSQTTVVMFTVSHFLVPPPPKSPSVSDNQILLSQHDLAPSFVHWTFIKTEGQLFRLHSYFKRTTNSRSVLIYTHSSQQLGTSRLCGYFVWNHGGALPIRESAFSRAERKSNRFVPEILGRCVTCSSVFCS